MNLCQRELDEVGSYWANGKIIKKYIDERNHNTKVVIIKNNDNQTLTRLYLTRESGLFDSLRIGYLVKKQKGSLKVYYGKESLKSSYVIDLGCNELRYKY